MSAQEYKTWYSCMSDNKRCRVDRYRTPADKKRSVVGDMLAKKAVAEYYGIKAEQVILRSDDKGKPFVADLPVHVSISHAGDLVAVAVSGLAVGIDIEKFRPTDLKVVNRICTDGEKAYIFESEALKNRRFFEIWTAKEAHFKRLGVGIAADWSHYDSKLEKDCTYVDVPEGYVCAISQSMEREI